MATKINQILTEWIPGDVHSLKWFNERGVPQNTAYEYFKSGTLERLGPGIYSRKNEKLKWFGGVRLLQEELEKKIHISDRTALELHGHSHYVSLVQKPIVFLTSYKKRESTNLVYEIRFFL
jgi:hypothetical protein